MGPIEVDSVAYSKYQMMLQTKSPSPPVQVPLRRARCRSLRWNAVPFVFGALVVFFALYYSRPERMELRTSVLNQSAIIVARGSRHEAQAGL
jgi:hypothetical protein